MTKQPPEGMTVSLLDESDIYNWQVTMEGPEGSLYAVRSSFPGALSAPSSIVGPDRELNVRCRQGGHYRLLLALPAEYPFKPPSLNFKTKIYHPNITNDDKGAMCLAMLRSEEWKPSTKILGVLQTARNLLLEPNPDDAVEGGIADQYKTDRKQFDKVVKEWVKKYAQES